VPFTPHPTGTLYLPAGENLSPLNPIYKVWKKCSFHQMLRHEFKVTRIMEKQGNMTPQRNTIIL
jgi:hypothetical protein